MNKNIFKTQIFFYYYLNTIFSLNLLGFQQHYFLSLFNNRKIISKKKL